ncbi:5-oxoprolinase subunit PxpB [Ochrovirga pacifica]|uniref:5-oxoprolinase subunit PxpB n=1 Tax=Ochrovirga pacifica TaxID=1042376 RepID=UPI0002559B41|nr:5-oxoprolinase subunit PxpB [Ochrovirga pacifica]
MQYEVREYGETALLIQFKHEISLEVHLQVKALYHQLKKIQLTGVLSLIPAYNSLTLVFDPEQVDRDFLSLFLNKSLFKKEVETQPQKTVEIPVCYQEPYALDLLEVSQKTGLSPQEIIDKHTQKKYLVNFIGFAPGFMYLSGLDSSLFVARKENPRAKIEAGSVGLADQQTGVYPLETPGGWQIIGQTPWTLFSKDETPLVQMGDYVQFVPISTQEFINIKAQ